MRGSLELWLLGALWLRAATPSAPPPRARHYQVVRPLRLPGPRARRSPGSGGHLYPESVSYVLGARGLTFTLHLRKNRDLVSSSCVETYTAANGSRATEQLPVQDHCFYQGHVEGHPRSAASLSTCAGLRGFFQAAEATHLIEPLGGADEAGPHALYLAEQLPPPEPGTCGVSDASLERDLGPRVSAAFRPRNWPPARETRYVELYVVADKAEFQRCGSRSAVRTRVLEVVNYVDKLYQALNFRVVLVGLEIWNDRDKIHISAQADTTLDNFLAWRAADLVGRHQHDNAQLITAVDFTGTTVGLAKVSAMCTQDSGAVNQDHHQHPAGVASTMAHEMGHNLGMDHDQNVPGCYCPVPREGGGCVMASSLSATLPRVFSQCSRADLETFVEKTRSACLGNPPDPSRLVGGPVCGNQFVERGEQCDCGPPEDCRNPCCNATTCRLAEGAECAQGACCRDCKVQPAGVPCRPPKDGCDLEERCDGRQPACPEDAFRENGTPCAHGYCYNGNCPSLAGRCQALWGPGARAAAEMCSRYRLLPSCQARPGVGSADVCGVLFCEGGQKPQERRSCILTVAAASCQALGRDEAAFEQVPEGTRCGEEKVCWEGACRDLGVYRTPNCSARCSGRGECNHKGQCHCPPGWAPPRCAAPLAAADRAASGARLAAVLVPTVLLAALVVAGVVVGRRVHKRRSAAPGAAVGLANPLFQAGEGAPAAGRAPATPVGPPELVLAAQPCQPSRPTASAVTPRRPPRMPPAALPSGPCPVPVYAPPAAGQLRPAPPTKAPPALRPKQVPRPTCTPPMPPVKAKAGEAGAGPAQGAADTKAPAWPPARRR